MNVKLIVKSEPADNPGTWCEATLKLYVKAERPFIILLEQAITKALSEINESVHS
jgi:hypothetical protein